MARSEPGGRKPGLSCWRSGGSSSGSTGRSMRSGAATGSGEPLIRAGEPAHGEFDHAVGQFPPVLDRAHIGLLRIALEVVPRPGARRLARQREGLAQKAVVAATAVLALAAGGHPACEIA